MVDDDDEVSRVEAAQAISLEPLEWLEPIYRSHAREVLQAAYRVTGNPDDAEDVLQTVFLRLARMEVTPDFSKGAGAYLRRAATNAALDLVQSRYAKSSTPIDGITNPLSSDDAGPERRHFSVELQGLLRRAIAKLGARGAEVFVLKYFEGMDNRSIAQLLDTTPGTVAVTLHRTRSRLMDELASYLGGVQ
jgi:RNA polymerase sigma-70 factor (ECF subfamily)